MAQEISTSRSLIRRVQTRDSAAWQTLAELYGPIVFGWIRRAGLNDNDAADVSQNVFQTLLRSIDRFGYQTVGSTFRGWLRTVTINEVRQFWRANKRQPAGTGGTDHWRELEQTPFLEEQAVPAEDQVIFRELTQRAVDLLRAEFEERTWTAFWRVTIDEQPAADVAEELGMTANAVRQAKFRVLCRLRELLDEP